MVIRSASCSSDEVSSSHSCARTDSRPRSARVVTRTLPSGRIAAVDDALKRRSAEEQISPSALARRLLRQALQAENQPVLTTRQVEEIARRIMRESA